MSDKSVSKDIVRCVGNYDIGKTIGKGRFGKVKIATHVLTGEIVAVKIIRKRKHTPESLEFVRKEIQTLKKFSHPNIVQLYEVIETERVLFLIMEYAPGGEVLDFVVTHGKISEDKARELFRQVLAGIHHCHSHQIVHRDLKAENLLLSKDLQIKIIDFGLSAEFSENSLLTAACGSPAYASPEVILRQPYRGPEVDIWSMGVVLYVLLCGKLPFQATDLLELYNLILKSEYDLPSFLSESCKQLFAEIFVGGNQRISLENIISHPWVQSLDGWELPVQTSPDTPEVDLSILHQMEQFGFDTKHTIDSVLNHSCNQASATFSLLSAREKRNRHWKSISIHPHGTGKSESVVQYLSGVVSVPNSMPSTPESSPCVSPRSIEQSSIDSVFAGWTKINSTSQRRAKQAEKSKTRKTKKGGSHIISRVRSAKGSNLLDSTNGNLLQTASRMNPVLRSTAQPDLLNKQTLPKPTPPCTVESTARLHRRSNSDDLNSPKREDSDPSSPSSLNRFNQSCQPVTKPLWSTGKTSVEENEPPKLSVQELEAWEQLENYQHSRPAESNWKFDSILSWTKHYMGKKEASVASVSEPRIVRIAFSNSTTSIKPPTQILHEIERVLTEQKIQFEHSSRFCFKCLHSKSSVRFEVEVCTLLYLTKLYVVRLKRIAGEWMDYKSVCDLILGSVVL